MSSLPPSRITGADAQRLVSAGALLLDVRTPEEFAGGHVTGALNIPVQVLGQRLGDLPKEREIVVYCQSGGRSARAAADLRRVGYTVHDLGGMGNWGAP